MKKLCLRLRSCIQLMLLSTLLTACITPALLLSPQSQLMWAVLKPMVGLDPKEANLFRQPMIQSRLEPLLASHYASAVQLLETADKIQQEGPLFYVVSKYTPVPELAEKVGFVWNSETNQMAVLLVSGGAPQVFAEKLNAEMSQQIPLWPAELTDYTDPAKLQQQALHKAKDQLKDSIPVPSAVAPLLNTVSDLKDVRGQTKALLKEKKQALVDETLSPLTDAKQHVIQLKDQAVSTATAPITDAKQQAQQQVQQLKDQAVSTATAPITDAKQQAEQQVQQLKDQTVSTVTAPITDAKQQAEQQVQQLKDQAVSTATAPITDAKQQAEQQVQQLKDQAVSTVTAPITDAKQQAQQQAAQQVQQLEDQLNTKVEAPVTVTTPATALDPEDDLAAELATEQQSLKNEQSQQIIKLQKDIALAEQQLKQASSTTEISKLQLQIRQLKAALQLLQTSN